MRKKLTQKQFAQAVALHPRMEATTRKMAQQVLVNQARIRAIAEQYQTQEQAVQRAATTIYKSYVTDIADCPDDWVVVELCAPKKLAEHCLAKVKTAKYTIRKEKIRNN